MPGADGIAIVQSGGNMGRAAELKKPFVLVVWSDLSAPGPALTSIPHVPVQYQGGNQCREICQAFCTHLQLQSPAD